MNTIQPEPETPENTLAVGLALSITSPATPKTRRAVRLAEQVSALLDKTTIDRAMKRAYELAEEWKAAQLRHNTAVCAAGNN